GQVVKFTYGDNSLIVNGTLKATGTLANPVIFTSFNDDSAGGDTNNNGNSSGGNGDWAAIQFNSGSTNNVLDHVEVRYAGGWSQGAAVYDKGGPLSLTNGTVRNSFRAGVRIEGASPTLTNDTWTNNVGAAVSMDLAASPAISGVTFTNNGINGV